MGKTDMIMILEIICLNKVTLKQGTILLLYYSSAERVSLKQYLEPGRPVSY